MKKRRRVLSLFISIFLRNRSLSDARWFYGQKRKIGMVNLYLTENRLSWNEMCSASDYHNYKCHTCAKEFLNSSFNKAVIEKISNLHNIAPNFTFSQKTHFFKYICNFLDQPYHLYKFYGRDMSGILFLIFASCEPLSYIKFVFHLLKNAVCIMTWLASFHVISFFCILYGTDFSVLVLVSSYLAVLIVTVTVIHIVLSNDMSSSRVSLSM